MIIFQTYRRLPNSHSQWHFILVYFLFMLLLLSNSVFGQQSFTPLKQGEYEVREESKFFNPGIIVEGSYDAYYSIYKKGFVNGEDLSDVFLQDIELKIKSKVNTNLSVHAYIGNKSKLVSKQDDPYYTEYPDEASDSTSDGAMDLEFREAYLEYNHNPNARLLLGKQFINIGDRIGMIYQGRANAISQQCRIGTWCYYVGGARIGNEGDSALFWFQIDYPVFESGVMVSDPWVTNGTRQEESFNVELLRVDYRGTKVPLSKSGMWIGKRSIYQDSIVSGTTKYMYFENNGVQYMGFNLRWNYYNTLLRFSWINLAGKRDYYSEAEGAGREFLSTQSIAGNAYYLDTDYRFHKNWKMGLTLFTSTGNKLAKDGDKIWEKTSNAYMEVQNGDFGDALIYFNGKEGLGQGHSVSNLTFYGFRSSFIDDLEKVSVYFALYSFNRTQPVFYNVVGEEEKTSTDIGTELDFIVNWRLEDKLTAGLQIAAFVPGNAYSSNDNIRPIKDPEDFSLIGLNVHYSF